MSDPIEPEEPRGGGNLEGGGRGDDHTDNNKHDSDGSDTEGKDAPFQGNSTENESEDKESEQSDIDSKQKGDHNITIIGSGNSIGSDNRQKEKDPTEEIADYILEKETVLNLNEVVDRCANTLLDRSLIAIRCADEEVHQSLINQIAQHENFDTLEKFSFRNYFVEREIERDESPTFFSLYNRIIDRVIHKGERSVIFIHETAEGLGKRPGDPVFLPTLERGNTDTESAIGKLQKKKVFLVYFYYSDHLPKDSADWHWPDVVRVDALQLRLSHHYGAQSESIYKEIRQQQAEKLWPRSEYGLIREVCRMLENGSLENQIQENREILQDPQKLRERLGQNEVCIDLLDKNYLNRIMLFIAVHFPGIGYHEMGKLVESLLKEEEETYRKRGEKYLLKWQGQSDKIIRKCQLIRHSGERGSFIDFRDAREGENFRASLDEHYSFLLKKLSLKLLHKGFFFEKDASEVLITGMFNLIVQMAKTESGHFLKTQMGELRQQLQDRTGELEKSFHVWKSRVGQKRSYEQQLRLVEQMDEEQAGKAIDFILRNIEEGNYRSESDLKEHVNFEKKQLVKKRIHNEKQRRQIQTLKAGLEEKVERADIEYRLHLQDWRKLMKRFARLIHQLYNENDNFQKDMVRWLDDWQSSGQQIETFLEILEYLNSDYRLDALPWFKKIVNSPERNLQIQGFRKILLMAAKNEVVFDDLLVKFESWKKESDNLTSTRFAWVFPLEFLQLLRENYRLDPLERKTVYKERGREEEEYLSRAYFWFNSRDFDRSEWGVMITWVLGQDIERAYLSLYKSFKPEASFTDKEWFRILHQRIAEIIENWHFIASSITHGESDPLWQSWNAMLEIIAEKTDQNQRAHFMKFWQNRLRRYKNLGQELRKSEHQREENTQRYMEMDERRESGIKLYGQFKNLTASMRTINPAKIKWHV